MGGGSGWGGGRVGGGVRVDVNEELKFCENSKKKLGGGVGWWGFGGGSGLGGGQGGCERRIEVVFMKIQKNWGGGGGVRVDLNEELKFFGKIKKRILGGLGGGSGCGRVGLGGSGWM